MKYTFHARNSDITLLHLDYFFIKDGYGDFDYRILHKDKTFSAFLSEKGIRQTYNFGIQLMNEDTAKQVIDKLKKLVEILKALKIKEIDKNNLLMEWEKIDKILREYSHLYRYCEKPMLEPLEQAIIKACPDITNLNEVLHNPDLAGKLNFSGQDIRILKTLVELGKLKYKVHLNSVSLFKTIDQFCEIIAEKYNLSFDQASCLRINEFKEALKGKKPDEDLLNKRLNGCVFLPSGEDKWLCLTGKHFNDWKNKLEKIPLNEIRGTVTYPGKVIGRAKLHLSIIKSSEINKGDILVTGMTNPQILPSLSNAAAIITDEGGLLCHAAIVSREFKIPCIVGTKIATKVFKDGDLVEVDATKGVVRKIK
jgi:phosphohistidine swiveling domain-containing protein